MHEFVPAKIIEDVVNNRQSYKVEYVEVCDMYSRFTEEVLEMIMKIDGISKIKKEEIRQIVNSYDSSVRKKYQNKRIKK